MFNKMNFILYCEIEIEFIAEDMVNVRIRLYLAEIRREENIQGTTSSIQMRIVFLALVFGKVGYLILIWNRFATQLKLQTEDLFLTH